MSRLAGQTLLETASKRCEYEKKCSDCELFLNMFRLELKIILEKYIWGEITQAKKNYTKINNKYMEDQYSPDAMGTYFQYFGSNNPYGWTMIQKVTWLGMGKS